MATSLLGVGILPSLLLLICLATLLRYPTPTTCSTNDTDYLSLLAFKNAIHDDPFGALNSWNHTTQLCSWEGITCGRRHPDRVVGINLRSKGLVGSLSPTLGNMSFLRAITLQNNSFHGVIPNEIGFLRRLEYLEFSNNSFGGAIPTNLSHCSNLVYLNLIGNRLYGAIPVEFGYLSKLQDLGLGMNNQLSGYIPPSIGNLTCLVQLSLPACNLIGEIPESLGQLRNMKYIFEQENRLVGTIPLALFNISTILRFDVSDNHLGGSIPSNIWLPPNLLFLSLAQNQFSGVIPSSLANASSLEILILSENNFRGRMPMLGTLSQLHDLVVGDNPIDDDIKFISPLVNCTYLEILQIGPNPIIGVLPNSFGNLSSHLKRLEISGTLIHGKIPSSIGKLNGLIYVSLSDNSLEGSIPSSIGKLSYLGILDLGENRFTGKIPYSLGNLTLLNVLSMEDNHLSGSILKSLNHCTNLLYLDLSHNNLGGAIPLEIITLSSLSIFLNLSSNALTYSLPPKIDALSQLSTLDLSNNRLSGVIPNSLSGCKSLELLLLDRNLFEGDIPHGLSDLKGLRDLDLSRNQLSGLIPSFLGVLRLERLNLSYNRLHGEVPKLGVFANQSAISVEGNRDLCGGILELKLPPCTVPNLSKKHSQILLKLLIPIGVVFFLCLGGIIFFYPNRKSKKDLPSPTDSSFAQILRLSYSDLLKATSGFSESSLIGVGRFGSVYKGILEDGETMIAVKVLNLFVQGASKSFKKECNALRHIRHRNLLKILSVCESIDFKGNDFKSLVYEFKGNGSLEKWMYHCNFESNQSTDEEVRKLDIIQRINIAIDVAHALEYLHCGTESTVVHGDLKPSNILLDDDMTSCVGDFGLAKVFSSIVPMHENSSSIGIKGTIGYVPPEYGMSNLISTAGGVYSYGILLLELFTNQRPTNSLFIGHMNLHNFVSVALPNRIEEIVDPHVWIGHDMNDERFRSILVSILSIGVLCSKENPKDRMSMTEVVHELCKIKASYSSQL